MPADDSESSPIRQRLALDFNRHCISTSPPFAFERNIHEVAKMINGFGNSRFRLFGIRDIEHPRVADIESCDPVILA